jgi:hypothetical protein
MASNTISSVAPATYTHYEALTPLGCLFTDSLDLAMRYVRDARKGKLTEIVEARRQIPVAIAKKSTKRTRRTAR